MPTDEMQRRRYEFKKALHELSELKGRGTELISLYIPPGKQIYDVVQYLREEYSTSSNIKSKSTRKNVLSAIESIMSKLKYYKSPPENGLVFFVGHVASRGDQTEMYSKIIEPPEPIQTFMYKCDSMFHTELLGSMLEEKEIYGLIVMDRKEATIGLLSGTNIQVISNEQSLVPSKHHQGGQSSRRYERLIEIAAHEYFKKIGEIANNAFMPNIRNIIAIFLGGPGSTKNFFLEKDYLRNELKEKIKETFDVGYTDESGLRELVDKASGSIKDMHITREKDLVNRFLMEIRKVDGGLGVYGIDNIFKAMENRSVDILLVSEALQKSQITYTCPVCGSKKVLYQEKETEVHCDKDQSIMNVTDKKDVVDLLYEMADAAGTTVELISAESDEGKLLIKAFGGLAAILRYVPNQSLSQTQ
ncbi:MAG: peptide chain release factor aRF-1 [Candidatus Thermoplasmatota archaeon]|nr:peptide chain release factor aRF-1 [Candidatus Thermoplasmatota archaeon]MCL5666026.1 peptide chain release factor aRF-1 [Candidatus Thermoplasmatota archaeon]